jgi:hypothetical protein
MEIIIDVAATPRDASKQGGQDRVRTLSLAAGLASAPAVEPPCRLYILATDGPTAT